MCIMNNEDSVFFFVSDYLLPLMDKQWIKCVIRHGGKSAHELFNVHYCEGKMRWKRSCRCESELRKRKYFKANLPVLA